MLIDWFMLIGALVLLLPPVAIFHGRRVRYRALAREWDNHWRRIFTFELNLFDFLRAAAGAWLLAHAVMRLPDARGVMGHLPTLIQAGIMAVATGGQTLVSKDTDTAQAPFFFVGGLVAGFLPPLIALFALVLAVALTFGARAPTAFFLLLSSAVVAAGMLLMRPANLLGLAAIAGAIALPWLLTVLFRRHFVLAYRSAMGTAGSTTATAPRR